MDRQVLIRLVIYMFILMLVVLIMMNSGPSIQLPTWIETRLRSGGLAEPTVAAAGRNCKHQPSWMTKNVDQMDELDIINFIRWNNATSCRAVNDFGGHFLKANGISAYDGQRSICLDMGLVPKAGACVIYTTHNGETELIEFFEQYGCQVFIFNFGDDSHDKSANVHVFKTEIGDRDTDKDEEGRKLMTLSSIYKMLSKRQDHEDVVIDYVKIDTEGLEWKIMPQLVSSGMLDKIKQLSIEVHYSNASTLEGMRSHVSHIRAIEDAGMIRFSNRPNLYWPGSVLGIREYHIVEFTWYNPKYRFD